MIMNRHSLPDELVEFFRSSGGKSLIIKGAAGTGKTTLSLEILEQMAPIERTFFISSRVAENVLFRYYPKLMNARNMFQRFKAAKYLLYSLNNFILEPSEVNRSSMISRSMDFLSCLKKSELVIPINMHKTELSKLKMSYDMPDMDGELPDGPERGDNPFENPMSRGKDLLLNIEYDLPEIEKAYDAIMSGLPRRSYLVIDSLDALSQKYGLDTPKFMVALQRDLAEKSNCNIIFVLESYDRHSLDYLSDGVIILNIQEMEQRRVRVLEILKLRGCGIKHHKYLFTLEKGRFKTLLSTLPKLADIAIRPRSQDALVPDTAGPIDDPGFRPTGIRTLDDLLNGGLAKGTLTLFETGQNIPMQLPFFFLIQMAIETLRRNGGVLWFLSKQVHLSDIIKVLSKVEGDLVRHLNRFLTIDAIEELKDYMHEIPFQVEKFGDFLGWDINKDLLEGATPPNLFIIDFDYLTSIIDTDLSSSLQDILHQTARTGNMVIGFAKWSLPDLRNLSDISSVHLRFERMGHNYLLFGEKPFSQIFNVDLRMDKRFLNFVLDPIY